ncbi:hypothetical protein [Photobacterium sp. DNB22_13_2]
MRYFVIALAFVSQLVLADIQVPVDTDNELFGLGIAETELEAERAALSAIAVKLSANIQVEQKEHLISRDGHSSSSFEEVVNISSGRLVFPPYRVIARDDSYEDNIQVVISMGKKQLLDFYQQYLAMEYQQISTTLAGVKNQDPLNALPLILSVNEKMDVNETILQVIAGLNSELRVPDLHQQHISLRQGIIAVLHRGGWSVVSDNRSQTMANLLSQSIVENELITDSDVNYQFVLSTREQSAQRNKQFLTKRDIKVELRQEGRLQSVMSHQFTLISEPGKTHEATIDSLDNQLAEKFGQNMLFTLLGNSDNEN